MKANDIKQLSYTLLLQQNAVQCYVAAGLSSQYYKLYFSHSPGSATYYSRCFTLLLVPCSFSSSLLEVNASFHFLVNLKGNVSIILTF